MTTRAGTVTLPIVLLVVTALFPVLTVQGATYEKRDRHIFELLDENVDGVISMPEFKNNQMLIFYIMDRNRDLVLTRNETALPEDVFDRVAGTGGKINTMEFLTVVDSAFKHADTNRDLSIDRAEFNALMRRIRD